MQASKHVSLVFRKRENLNNESGPGPGPYWPIRVPIWPHFSLLSQLPIKPSVEQLVEPLVELWGGKKGKDYGGKNGGGKGKDWIRHCWSIVGGRILAPGGPMWAQYGHIRVHMSPYGTIWAHTAPARAPPERRARPGPLRWGRNSIEQMHFGFTFIFKAKSLFLFLN